MPYARPTLTTLIQQSVAEIAASPVAEDGLLDDNVLEVLAITMAGLAYEHYDYQDSIARQTNPWSATDEYADGWAALRGVTRKPATQAVVSIARGGHQPGVSIPTGTGFTRGDGAAYASIAATNVADDGTAIVQVRANDAGTIGNCGTGVSMTLSGSIAGLQAGGWMVTGTVATAADIEQDDALKARSLKAWSAPAQGGSLLDWVDWALAVPGVTRAWVVPGGWGPGTIMVYVMMDQAEALYRGFPQGANGVATNEARDTQHRAVGDQLAVADALFAVQPVTALAYACAPIEQPVPFVIQGLGAANTAANQAAIVAALDDMFLQLAQVGGARDPGTGAAYPPIATSSWYGAIAAVLGNNAFTVSAPAAPLTPAAGQLFTRGPITFAS